MEKINIAELLKDCPKGMELDCTMWDNLYFDRVDNDLIHCYYELDGHRNTTMFCKNGCYTAHKLSKCVIFPKGKTTWEGFFPPCKFKDGDILFHKHKSNNIKYIFIYKRRIDKHYLLNYCGWFSEKPLASEQFNVTERVSLYENDDIRFATEEEKQKLFDAIKENGYKWNAETKTLEKLVEPMFKVGDRVQRVLDSVLGVIVKIDDKGYYINFLNNINGVGYISFILEKDYVLVPNKFDVNTLKCFESKVLVRNYDSDYWKPAIFGFAGKDKNTPFCVEGGNFFNKCIPYEGNEHLLSTREDCNVYYKTW